jgi:hypothetical protein
MQEYCFSLEVSGAKGSPQHLANRLSKIMGIVGLDIRTDRMYLDFVRRGIFYCDAVQTAINDLRGIGFSYERVCLSSLKPEARLGCRVQT